MPEEKLKTAEKDPLGRKGGNLFGSHEN